jgi:hydrogenase maturation protease
VVFAPVPRPLFATSSHAVGLAESIELARVLGSLPKRCVVFAVEGERFDLGAPLSAPVAEAVARVVAGVLHEMRVEAG